MTSNNGLSGVSGPEISESLSDFDGEAVSLYDRLLKFVDSLAVTDSQNNAVKLPSERTLRDNFGTTRNTLREALGRIESQGLIYRSNRRGWFIAPPRFRMEISRKADFLAMAQEQSREAYTRVGFVGRVAATKELKRLLGLQGSGRAMKIARARALDGRWIMVENMYLRPKDFPGIEKQDLTGSLTQLLREQYQADVTREETRIIAAGLPEEAAGLLDSTAGAPCLEVRRLRYGSGDSIIDYDVEYWLHNAIELVGYGQ